MNNNNRSAIWAIVGVLVGFGLPVLACVGLTFAFAIGLASLGSQSGVQPILPAQVSGPQTGPAVAIIAVRGTIVSGKAPFFSDGTLAAAGDLIPLIRQAAQDRDVRAIVLEVNSPGGGVVASDEIYHALEDVPIPIVVYMQDVAASGAYYISMAADNLVANPGTLVGSIGVISTFTDAEELLEKIGVQVTVITAGESKDFGSPYRSMTAEERAYWQTVLDETHEAFIERVATGRDMSKSDVQTLADGRIFTGRQALNLGLIDSLGFLDDAIAQAADLGAITGEPRVVRYQEVTPLSSLLGEVLQAGPGWLSLRGLDEALVPRLEYRWIP